MIERWPSGKRAAGVRFMTLLVAALVVAPLKIVAQTPNNNGASSVAGVAGEVAVTAGVAALGTFGFLTLRYSVEPVYNAPWSSAGQIFTTLLPMVTLLAGTTYAGAEISDRGRFTEATFGATIGGLTGGAIGSGLANLLGGSRQARHRSVAVGVGVGSLAGFLLGGFVPPAKPLTGVQSSRVSVLTVTLPLGN